MNFSAVNVCNVNSRINRERFIMHLRVWSVMLAALSYSGAVGQTTAFVNDLRAKLDQYYGAHIPLNLDAQFNQPSYVPGDTAWFSLWLTTEREGLPIADRQVVHVDLSTRSGNVIQQVRVLAKDGRGQGQIILPTSLEPGIYTAVFSTGWMANEGTGICGYHEFIVSGDHLFTIGTMPLQAHLEGGTLVENITNNILITGRPGATVSLMAGEDVLQQLMLDDLGYGHTTLKPISSTKYSVSDGNESAGLPVARQGVGVSLSFYDSVSSVILNLESSQARNGCNLAIVSRGKLVYTATVGLQNRSALITVPRRSLPEGLLLATVFDENNQPLAERLLVANPPSPEIKVTPHTMSARPRERVPISVEAHDPGIMLTVSIFAEDVFPSWQTTHNSVASVARLPIGALDFRIDPSWTLRQWNTFLITQRWKGFSWNDVWNSKHSGHRPEKYLRCKGKVLQSGSSDYDSVRVTFFLRNDARLYEAYADRTGGFDIEMYFDFYHTEEVIYTVDRKGKVIPDATLVLEAEAAPQIKLGPFTRTPTVDPYNAFAAFREAVADAYTNYANPNGIAGTDDPNAAIEDELFSADVTVRLDDYLLFPDMEETLREIVPKLQHRWKGKQHSVTVALSEPDGLAIGEPLYFIDGILTDDTNYFMALKPEDVATIKIISSHRKLNAMGMLGRNGVVLVTTKIPNNYLRVPHARKSFEVTGLTPLIKFDNDPATSKRTPMLRSSIYFNPDLRLNTEGRGSFDMLMPDNIGLFRVEVRGLTMSGAIYTTVSHVRSIAPTTTP